MFVHVHVCVRMCSECVYNVLTPPAHVWKYTGYDKITDTTECLSKDKVCETTFLYAYYAKLSQLAGLDQTKKLEASLN